MNGTSEMWAEDSSFSPVGQKGSGQREVDKSGERGGKRRARGGTAIV
jgi:hypothetical protein